jgi:predicted  nucleic acid-binding Zn-ribbon protein
MSDTANSLTAAPWQTALIDVEAQFLEVWRLGREQVKKVQNKRQEARLAAARLAEAQRGLAASESRSKESDKLAPLRQALSQAQEGQREALTEYERALDEFHKQRTRLHKEQEALSRRRKDLSHTLPAPVRDAYGALLGAGVPDPVAAVQDGRCAACGHDIVQQVLTESAAALCPSCKRLIVRSNS